MKHVANAFTVLRVVLTAVLAVFLLSAANIASIQTTRVFCAVVFLVAAVTDYVDGAFARRAGTVSDFGKFLDPVADKLLITTMFICLAVSPLTDERLHVFLAATAVIVLFRDLAVTSLRMLAAAKGVVLAARFAGKVKTFVQCLSVLWILIEPVFAGENIIGSFVCLCLCVICTLYSGAVFVPVYIKETRK